VRIKPFRDGDTFATFKNLVDKTVAEINSLENDYVLKASPTELESYYIDKITIRPLVLHAPDYHIESQSGTKIDVSHHLDRVVFPGERAIVQGTQLDIAIPYEGDNLLWRIRPSTFSLSGYPELEVRDDVVAFSITFPDDSVQSERLKKEIDSQVKSLVQAVENLRRDVENHNRTSPAIIRDALERKRKASDASVSAISNLGIPVKRRDQPQTFTVPTQRRRATSKAPSVPTEKYKPEPSLAEEEYQHILSVLRSMSMVIERNPHAFASLDEEAIRTHFLLQLNGHYEGSATGETFNASGKTDILIRVEDRNIFIAECKFWRGPKGFSEAVDQLLGYLSWRDSKCALLIFNKTKDSSAVRSKMHEVMEARPEYRKTVSHDRNGDSRYVFVKETDPGREITITTQLFDFPTTE
jgi:hypothetical protein